MKILVLSARMPYAVTEIRALGGQGHEVHAADVFAAAPGKHSREVAASHLTSSPREVGASAYAAEIGDLVDTHEIDLVLPTFEEAFYLTSVGPTVGSRQAPVFAPDFSTLARLHDKSAFVELARELGLDVPETRVCATKDTLEQAIEEFEAYFARPSYSRAGAKLLTNTGPVAGQMTVEEAEPTDENPWIVQRFVEGQDLCSFSIVHHGELVAHSTYQHPMTLDGAGGVIFESVEAPSVLAAVETIVEATDYHGQISLDFLQEDDGTLNLVECNPRATAGACVMPREVLVDALLGDLETRFVTPAGTRRMIRAAVLRDLFVNPTNLADNLAELLSNTRDVFLDTDDIAPGLYQFLTLGHVIQYWRSEEGGFDAKLGESYLHDVTWDGDELEPEETP